MTEPLVFNQFDLAIADSPHKGHALMRNIDIEAFSGAMKPGKITTSLFHTALSVAFTAVAATDVCTLGSGTTPATGVAVTVSSTGTLPAGLSASTNYFIINVSSSTFKLATTVANANAGTAIDITDTGSGTHTVTSVNPGTINHIIRQPQGSQYYFMHDSNGRVWYHTGAAASARLLNGNTLTNSSGKGIVTFTNSDESATYLFVFRNALIDVVNVTATSNVENPSWTSGWQTMNTAAGTSNSHQGLLGQDNIIYYADAGYVGSIKENSGSVFNPATGGTYTFTQDALDISRGDKAEWLEEQGTNLLIAGSIYNNIYPWDRLSDSFGLPIKVAENQILRLKNIGGTIYILAGTKGNIYTTLGTYAAHFKKLPDYVVNNSGTLQANIVTWGGIAARNGALLVGVGGQTSGNSGVYLIYPDGRFVIDNVPSTGSANATAVYAENEFYFIGYSGGADLVDTSRYANLEAVYQSELARVSTKNIKGTYSRLELRIAKPVAGNVTIGYRQNTDSSTSFTTISAFTTTTSATSYEADAGLIDIEDIQVQAAMNGNIEVTEIRLEP